MKKFIIFLILAIIGSALFTLAAINDNLYCSHEDDICTLKSKIAFINYTTSETQFKPNEIKQAYCDTAYQPNAGGKKPYYLLKIELNKNTEYTLGSYQKYGLCKVYADKASDFIKRKTPTLEYSPTFGFLNLMGAIFGFLMFVIGIVVLKAKPEEDYYDFDDDDDNDEDDDNKSNETENETSQETKSNNM